MNSWPGLLALAMICCLACRGLQAADRGDSPAKEPPGFKVTLGKADDRADVKTEGEKTTFSLTSPTGISKAVIERREEKWPATVVVRLSLKGLSSFRAANGKVTLDAAVSSEKGKPVVRVWKDGKETPGLDAKSPYWMDIRLVGGDGKPATDIPLKNGFFEVTLPQAFFEDSPKSITLQWIDFYR
jgi:hypothetical protein